MPHFNLFPTMSDQVIIHCTFTNGLNDFLEKNKTLDKGIDIDQIRNDCKVFDVYSLFNPDNTDNENNVKSSKENDNKDSSYKEEEIKSNETICIQILIRENDMKKDTDINVYNLCILYSIYYLFVNDNKIPAFSNQYKNFIFSIITISETQSEFLISESGSNQLIVNKIIALCSVTKSAIISNYNKLIREGDISNNDISCLFFSEDTSYSYIGNLKLLHYIEKCIDSNIKKQKDGVNNRQQAVLYNALKKSMIHYP